MKVIDNRKRTGKRRPSDNDKNLTQMVYEQFKEMMLHYELIPGQRLIFADLANRLGVSRTPVNTALSILAN